MEHMTPHEFINSLLEACPDIDSEWQEHLDFWDGDIPGFYNDISVIVHYVLSKYRDNNFQDLENVALVVDLGLNSGNPETSELALIGFLEGILFVGSHGNLSPINHKHWLRERSYCALVNLSEAFESLNNK